MQIADSATLPTDALLVDTRPGEDFAQRHLAGSVNIPISSGGFPTYLGWYVDYTRPTYLIAYENDLQTVMHTLNSIGVDHVPGYFIADMLNGELISTNQKTPREIWEAGMKIIDVRNNSEYISERIPGVAHIHMGKVLERLAEIPRHEPVAVQCGSGVRSQVVVSLLERSGFSNIINMQGGIDAWKMAQLPVEQS
jgi:hydroxyacylglutathione hydrolase